MRPGRIPTLDELLAAQAQRASTSAKRRIQGTKRKAIDSRPQRPASRPKTVRVLVVPSYCSLFDDFILNKQQFDDSDMKINKPVPLRVSASSAPILAQDFESVRAKCDNGSATAGDSIDPNAQPTLPESFDIAAEMKKIAGDLGNISTATAALQEHCHGRLVISTDSTYYNYQSEDTSGPRTLTMTTSSHVVKSLPITELLDDRELCERLNFLGIEVVAELQDFASWPNQRKRSFLGDMLGLTAFAVDKMIIKISNALSNSSST